MIEIYFYKETELKYSVYANNIEDVIEAPASYYADYTENMIISAIKYINPILENSNLREATREELVNKGMDIILEPGEIIQDNKLLKIPQPSKWHTWNSTDWTVNLEEVKAQKVQDFKSLRDKKISEDLEVDGALYQVRAEDLQKFFLKKVEHDLIPEANKKETWRLADNTYKEITFEDIKTILKAYGDRQRRIFYEFGVLEAQVNACQSVEEIEAIKWL